MCKVRHGDKWHSKEDGEGTRKLQGELHNLVQVIGVGLVGRECLCSVNFAQSVNQSPVVHVLWCGSDQCGIVVTRTCMDKVRKNEQNKNTR